jgi:hypothetical protein
MQQDPGSTELESLDSDGLFMRKVAQALRMSREERFRAGGELFDFACESARSGIRAALGTEDSERVEAQLRERLRLQVTLDGRCPQ